MTDIAERMKLARRLAGLTQEDAARVLDVTVRTYARWERCETTGFMGELPRIARAFSTTQAALTDAENVPQVIEEDVAGQLAELTSEVRRLADLIEAGRS